MFKEEIEDLKLKVKKLKAYFGDDLLLVAAFGSRVRDDFKGDSDLDVLVVLENRDFSAELKIAEIFYEDPLSPYSVIVWDRKAFLKHERLNTLLFREIMEKGKIVFNFMKGKNYELNDGAKVRAISNKS